MHPVRAVEASTPGLQAPPGRGAQSERTLLEQTVAERVGRLRDDLLCVVTVRMTTTALDLAQRHPP